MGVNLFSVMDGTYIIRYAYDPELEESSISRVHDIINYMRQRSHAFTPTSWEFAIKYHLFGIKEEPTSIVHGDLNGGCALETIAGEIMGHIGEFYMTVDNMWIRYEYKTPPPLGLDFLKMSEKIN